MCKFEIAQKLGFDECISYAELGKRCGLTEPVTRHVVRAAISLRYFAESENGLVRHYACSEALVKVPGLQDYAGFCTDYVAPAAVKWAESLKKFPGSEKTGESGFSIANGGQEGFFSSLDKDTKRRTRFAKGQALLMDHPARDPIHLVNSLDWSGKDCPKTVIGIGGSHGRLMEAF